MDEQFYSLAASQGGADPFKLDGMNANGWNTSREVDPAGNHVITATKDVSQNDVTRAFLQTPLGMKSSSGMPETVSFSDLIRRGLFTDTLTIDTTVPPLEGPSKAAASTPYAAAGANLAASIIGIHFELLVPGDVVSTNAERTTDGALRWDIGLATPTKLRAKYRIPDIGHIALAIGITIFVALVATFLLFRKRQRLAVQNRSVEPGS